MNVLVITVEGNVQYKIGGDKTVKEVLSELENCKGDFYNVTNSCAIKKNKIISVETFMYKESVEE